MVQLIVDSGCDLPEEFLRKYAIPVLPHSISVGKDTFEDLRNPAQMAHFYSHSLLDRDHLVASGPATEEAAERVLRETIAQGHKDIVVQTIRAANSPSFANTEAAARRLSKDGVEIHVVDSESVFSGQGVLALYMQSLIQKGLTGRQVKARAEVFARKILGFATIKDVYYLRERGRQKNEKSVSWAKAFVARSLNLHPITSITHEGSKLFDTVKGYDRCIQRVFETAIEKIKLKELLIPAIVVSIGGRQETIAELPGFKEFQHVAAAHKVKIFRTVMSLSGGINMGPDTFTLSLALK